ncbi:MAG: serine protease [Paracoccaceae bacterium]
MHEAEKCPVEAGEYLRRLKGKGGATSLKGLESSDGVDLSASRRRSSCEILKETLHRTVVEDTSTELGSDEVRSFVHEADRTMKKLADEGHEATLNNLEISVLEAVIETDGSRPSLLVQNNRVETDDLRLGDWNGSVSDFTAEIERAARATARVVIAGDLSPNSVAGTAWMIAPGLAVTAKHVVEGAFVRHGDDWVNRFNAPVTLNFDVEANAPATPGIKVSAVRWYSPDTIGFRLDLANLDMAVLELETEGPAPLSLAANLEFPPGEPMIHVIGHPKQPLAFGNTTSDVFEQIRARVFGDTFGVKRWSPGILQIGPGSLPEDINNHVMTHDASTLGGNSGSPVLDLVSFGDRAVGLHYGGYFEDKNYAHPIGELQKHVDSITPPVPSFV